MKLYEMLQTGLSSTEIYQSLISQEQAVNVLLAGNFNLLPIYTPADPNGDIRKALLRKIMSRYYNYDMFTADPLYFGSRMFWKLNQIMPTYTAKFNAVISAGEFEEAFLNGVIDVHKRTRKTFGFGNTNMTGFTHSEGSGTSEQSSEDTSFSSDYPQIAVAAGMDYNTAGSKSKGSSNGKSNTENTSNTENNTTSNTENTETNTDRHTRHLSPDEILLAKQKIMNLIINIDEEIVNAVSDLFFNLWDEDECDHKHKQKVEKACKEILMFAITLNRLSIRVSNLDFTEEQLGYINQIPVLKQQVETLTQTLAELQTDIDNLAGQMLPAVTAEDADKILMVSDAGSWAAIRLPNWAVEGF